MTESPDTRDSMLARVRDPQDRDAWTQFVAIYRPLVFRLARRRGFQDADAQDLAQQVMLAVSNAIGRWERRTNGGRFRTWLSKIARNAMLNALQRGPRDRASGQSSVLDLLNEHPDHYKGDLSDIELEYRRQMFRQAARVVREEVEPSTWQAFWLSTVEGQSVEEAAKAVGRSIGSVYAARSRVMRRLRDAVRKLEDTDDAN